MIQKNLYFCCPKKRTEILIGKIHLINIKPNFYGNKNQITEKR